MREKSVTDPSNTRFGSSPLIGPATEMATVKQGGASMIDKLTQYWMLPSTENFSIL